MQLSLKRRVAISFIIANAVVLVITAILHFVFFKFLKSFNGFVLTIYLILWAILFVLVEFSLLRTRTWFTCLYLWDYLRLRSIDLVMMPFCLFLMG